jgi:hypothetical protein
MFVKLAILEHRKKTMEPTVAIRKRMDLIVLAFAPWLLLASYFVARKYNLWLGVMCCSVGIGVFYIIYRLNKTPTVILDDIGIHLSWPIGTIRWNDILEIQLKSYSRAGYSLVIKLKDGSIRSASLQFLDISPVQIRDLMLARINSSKESN